MADDKTTKTPEQPVTDSRPGKETPPAPQRAGEGFRFPEPEKDGTGGKEPTGFCL